MSNFTPIFRTGTHTDSGGVEHKITVADLDLAVSLYDPKNHESPLVIGHPEQDAPAYGWVKELRREGDVLMASFSQVPDEIKEAVANGSYKKKSAAFYKNGALRHVGLLGATPPAVKGLGDVAFKEGREYREFVFNETQTGDGNMSKELQEALREKAEADARAKAAEEGKAQAEAKFAEADAEAKKEKEAREKAEKKFAEQEKAAKEKAVKDAAAARENQFSELIKASKVLPGEKEKILAVANALGELDADAATLTFSEGGKTTSESAEAVFWGLLNGRDHHGLLGEFAEAPTGGDEGETYDAAKAAAKF